MKIDRSFIDEFGKSPQDAVLVSGLLGLAHALDLEVVAEGAESAELLARLRVMGCGLVQGNFFSRPLPAEAAGALLAEKRTR